jgi:ribosome-associated toxin RatA of RatAB toxin-antitoxin module
MTVPERPYRISVSRHIACQPAEAYAVVEDIERFPEFMPNVDAIVILEADDLRKVAHWHTTIDDAPLDWVEEGIYDPEELRVRFRALEGVFDTFDGQWWVQPAEGGSRVTLELEYRIGLPEIDEVIGPILRDRLIENSEAMLDAINDRVLEAA